MKYFYLLVTFFFLSNTYGQDPQLFENTWHLQKLVIEGEDIFPPSNEEVSSVNFTFYDNASNEYDTNVCNSFFGELEYQGGASFIMLNYAVTLIFCNEQENEIFEGQYFSFFQESSGELIEDPFTYAITINGDEKTLVITNNRGDEAIYGDQLLSNESLTKARFSFYPNPVIDRLTVQYSDALHSVTTINVLDINGKSVLTATMTVGEMQSVLDINTLKTGMYFLDIKTGDGLGQVMKFVKK